MSSKKIALFIALAILSILAGAVFGLLDIFGFVDGRHALSLTLLVGAVFLIYAILIVAFLLNFAKRNRIYTFFLIASLLFGLTFFFMNLNPVLSLLATLLFGAFLVHVYSASVGRSKLFITFSPRELFFPILRSSFIFFLILLSVLTYTQSQKLISQNSLISPNMISFISKPTIFMVNQQLNSQLTSGASAEILDALPQAQREEALRIALSKTVQQMAQQGDGTVYGFSAEEIPIHLSTITRGSIDITPVIEAMLPNIALKINEFVQEFAVLAPFAVAFITFLLFPPLILPLRFVESLITLVLFKILLSTGFIHVHKEQREVDVPTL